MPKPVKNSYPKYQKWRFLQRSINEEELIRFADSIVKHHGDVIDDVLPDLLHTTNIEFENLKHLWLSIWVNLMHQMGLGYTWDGGTRLYATELSEFLSETHDVDAFYYYWGLKFQYPFSYPKQRHYVDSKVAVQPVVLLLQYLVEIYRITEDMRQVFLNGGEIAKFLMKSHDHSQVQSNCELIMRGRAEKRNYISGERDQRGFKEAYEHFFSRGRLFIQNIKLLDFSDHIVRISEYYTIDQVKTFLSNSKNPIKFTENTQDMRNFFFKEAYNELDPLPTELRQSIDSSSRKVIPSKPPKKGHSPATTPPKRKKQVVRNPKDLSGRFTKQLTLSRIFQSDLRDDLLSLYSGRCCICNIDVKDFLITSHIIPVSVDPSIAADRRNAVLLCLLHDKALEKGFIGISDDFRVVVDEDKVKSLDHPVLNKEIFERKAQKINLPDTLEPDKEYLRRHRNIHGL